MTVANCFTTRLLPDENRTPFFRVQQMLIFFFNGSSGGWKSQRHACKNTRSATAKSEAAAAMQQIWLRTRTPKQAKCSMFPPPAGKLTQVTLHKLQLFVPKHDLLRNASRSHAVLLGRAQLKTCLRQRGSNMGTHRAIEKSQQNYFCSTRRLEREERCGEHPLGEPSSFHTGKYVSNLLPRHASIPRSNCFLLGQGRETGGQGEEIKDVVTHLILYGCGPLVWLA